MSVAIWDGPLQKQIMLLKLLHEVDNRPNFGTVFDNNSDGEVRLWLARVGALLQRAIFSNSLEFKSNVGTLVYSWGPTRASIQIQVYNAIEELKLELELSENEQIGKIYKQGNVYKFASDVLSIIGEAKSEVFIVDPYLDTSTFSILFPRTLSVSVHLFCGKDRDSIEALASKFRFESETAVEVRKSKLIHDRLIIIDGRDCWIMGPSIKDGGLKPTYLIPLQPDLSAQTIEIYQSMWEQAQ